MWHQTATELAYKQTGVPIGPRPWRALYPCLSVSSQRTFCVTAARAGPLLKDIPAKPTKEQLSSYDGEQELKQDQAQSLSVQSGPSLFPQMPQMQLSMDPWGLLNNTTNFANQLITHFAGALTQQKAEQLLQEASVKERELQQRTLPPNIWHFLVPVPIWELKLCRKLSSLTALTYKMHLVTPGNIARMHKLELITTSYACEIRPYEHARTAEEVLHDGDGMAMSPGQALQLYRVMSADGDPSSLSGTPAANIVSLPKGVSQHANATGGSLFDAAPAGDVSQDASYEPLVPALPLIPLASNSNFSWYPSVTADAVAAKLAEAAAAASAAAAPLASAASAAADSFYQGIATSLPFASRPSSSASNGNGTGSNTGASSSVPASGSPMGSMDGEDLLGWESAGVAVTMQHSARMDRPRMQQSASAAEIASIALASLSKQQAQAQLAQKSAAAGGSSSPGPAAGLMGSAALAPRGVTGNTAVSAYMCPSQWFVCDDAASSTRIFVIQGSDTVDHWKLNLTFEPVPFEDPGLGLKVHRGVYEAALVLYERFQPLVYEHVESSPFAKVAFTGHSIGGCMAMLLMLMFRMRGVLPNHAIAPVITFGAPAVFCQDSSPWDYGTLDVMDTTASSSNSNSASSSSSAGNSSSAAGSSSSAAGIADRVSMGKAAAAVGEEQSHASTAGNAAGANDFNTAAGAAVSSASAASASRQQLEAQRAEPTIPLSAEQLLVRLGLPEHIIRNITMARDVVPRAFTCDYSPVADIVRSWGPSLREHTALKTQGRKHLYYFLGRTVCVQPDRAHTFVAGDKDHPMLPPGPEVYAMVDPSKGRSATFPAQRAAQEALLAQQPAAPLGPPAATLEEAVYGLMDNPHPLETLADPGAYLAQGIISRYHNPEHYTKAIGRLIHLKREYEKAGPSGPMGQHGCTIAGSVPRVMVAHSDVSKGVQMVGAGRSGGGSRRLGAGGSGNSAVETTYALLAAQVQRFAASAMAAANGTSNGKKARSSMQVSLHQAAGDSASAYSAPASSASVSYASVASSNGKAVPATAMAAALGTATAMEIAAATASTSGITKSGLASNASTDGSAHSTAVGTIQDMDAEGVLLDGGSEVPQQMSTMSVGPAWDSSDVDHGPILDYYILMETR